MPIDPSIALRSVSQVDSPFESMGKAASLKSLLGQQRLQEMQIQQAEQQQEQERAFNDAYRTSVGAGGQLDRGALLSSLASRGLGSRIPALQKQFADADKAGFEAKNTQSQINERDFGVMKKRLDAAKTVISSVLSRTQNPTHQDFYSAIAQAAEEYQLTPQEQATMARGLPGDPTQLRGWAFGKGAELLEAGKRMEMLTPKFEFKNTGKQMVPVDTNALTNPTPQALAMTTTPGEDQSAATTRRGQNMVDARTREAAASAQFIPVDGVGLFVGDKRTGTAKPVTDPQGNPIKPEKAPPQFAVEGAQKAVRAMSTIDDTIKILDTEAGKGALGLKNLAPGAIGRAAVNWADAAGVDARAAVADIGSLEIKDRSGATVTIGEEPRLIPFIPVPTDSAEVAGKKLKRLREAVKKDYEVLGEFYPGVKAKGDAAMGRQGTGAPVPVKSDADYDKLPSGTRFLAPDGTTRVKP